MKCSDLKIFAVVTAVAVMCGLVTTVCAHEYYTALFKIIHPWAVATAPGASTAPVYLKFEEVSAGDRLIGARSDIAGAVELRGGAANDVGSRPSNALAAINVEPGITTELAPEGMHLVLIDLKAPLQLGRSYPLTLIFEKSGAIDTMLSVGAD